MLAPFLIGRPGTFVPLIVAAILLLAGAGGVFAGAPPPLTGAVAKFARHAAAQPVAPVTFQGADGNPLSLDAFGGQVVLVNLWATWCAPCIQEMPSLDRLQAKFGDRGFVVLAISLDRGGARLVQPFYERAGIKALAIYLEPTFKIASALGVRGMPTSLLLDRQGREIGRLEGEADWDAPEATALIEYFLNQPPE